MKIHLWNLLAPNRNRGATSAAAADPDQDQDVAEEPEVLEAGGVVRKISIISQKTPAEVEEATSNADSDDDRVQWDSPLEFVLSCLSFAVGLGNIWRFPYLCYRNGGGAFLIPYALNIFLTGIPLFFFELALGQFASKSPISIWSVSPLFQGLGLSMLVISVTVGSYYNVIISWTVYYFGATLSSFGRSELPWTTCKNWWNSPGCQELHNVQKSGTSMHNTTYKSAAEEYFSQNVLQMSASIEEVGSLRPELVVCLAITWIIILIALLKGVKSFGKAVYFTALFPYLILTILLARGLTLPGAIDGVMFYIKPDWSKLADHQVWADAAIQIFFSLGPCWGALITLASYNKFSNNCFRDAVFIGLANCATSFFAGFVVFSFVGFMAYELDTDVKQVAATGPGLAFVVYPEAVSLLPGGHIWSLLFFLMLLALGFGTQFSIVAAIVTIIKDAWPREWGQPKHRNILIVMCLLMFLMGLTMITNGGMYVLQLLDNHAGTFSALFNGLVEIAAIAWIYGVDRFLGDIQMMFKWRKDTPFFRMFQRFWSFMWSYVTPTLLLTILAITFYNHKPMSYADFVYPTWANVLGWVVSGASVIFIPLVACVKMAQAKGSLTQRFTSLLRCTEDWGPIKEHNKTMAMKKWRENGHYFPLRELNDIPAAAPENEDLLAPEA